MRNDNNIKVSVIIPVYNVEKYLERQIESVLNQSLKDIEVFLVDDGSTDGTASICDKYQKIDSRIKVIHKKNEGAHKARNVAIALATGEYLAFFDGDDEEENDMLFDMYKIAIDTKSDLVIIGFYIDTYYDKDQDITLDYIPKKEITYIDKESFRKDAYMFFDNNIFYSPWNKLYKRDYIINNNILFPQTYRDDFPFVVEVIKDIDKISFTQKQYYRFKREREESETSKYYKNLYEKRIEEHKMMLSLYEYWGLLNDQDSKEMIMRRHADRIIECITNFQNKKSNLTNKEINDNIRLILDENYTKEAFQYAKPSSLYLKIMYFIIKTNNLFLINLMTKFISFVKMKFIKVFSILKKDR